MKYDFTSIIERRGLDAIAVDHPQKQPKDGFDYIPMWVADMNFATVDTIQKKIIERVEHPCYGYFDPRDEYYDAIIDWQKTRNGVTGLAKENIGYENGVLGGVASALRVFAQTGDKVLLHSPTYIGFTGTLNNAGYKAVHSPLVLDENNIWRMDFEDMEKRIVEEHIHVAIFCSPHNPCGRVWEKWEIEKAMELFKKYDVDVISDEIWADIVLNGHKHIPTQSVSEDARNRTVALYAPSKTFNLAGLIGSYRIVYNKKVNERMEKEESLTHYNHLNVLSMYALMGGYCEEGKQWVDELTEVLSGNINYAYDFITTQLPGVTLAKPEGTYMLFIDCKEYCQKHNVDVGELLDRGWNYGVGYQDGRRFFGEYCIRINLALPLSRVKEAFDRMKKYVFVD